MNNIKGFYEFNKINEEFHLEFDQHAANTMWDMFGILFGCLLAVPVAGLFINKKETKAIFKDLASEWKKLPLTLKLRAKLKNSEYYEDIKEAVNDYIDSPSKSGYDKLIKQLSKVLSDKEIENLTKIVEKVKNKSSK